METIGKMLWRIADLDVVFISYDEPNADANFSVLASCAPRAPKRVHGVKGFHAAYRAAADVSTTARFVTVDGDNTVRPDLFTLDLDDQGIPDVVFAFSALNSVNGLVYGNGAVKCWPKSLLTTNPTHESAGSGPGRIDFNFAYRYWRLPMIGSDNHFASTPFHAFRSGYREAVKLSLVRGKKLDCWNDAKALFSPGKWSRFLVWLSVGSDAPNGLWAILGARMAVADLWIEKTIKPEQISQYDLLLDLWKTYQHCDLRAILSEYERILNALSIRAPLLEPNVSAWFKETYLNYSKHGLFDLSGITTDAATENT
jgi:hypothetical protein